MPITNELTIRVRSGLRRCVSFTGAHERLRRRLQPLLWVPEGHTIQVAGPGRFVCSAAAQEPDPTHPLFHGEDSSTTGRPAVAGSTDHVSTCVDDVAAGHGASWPFSCGHGTHAVGQAAARRA